MKKIYIILGIILLVFLGLGIYIQQGLFRKAGHEATFTVDEGQGTRDIASALKSNKFISSPLLFSLYVYQRHFLLQPGVYDIKSEMSAVQIASLLHEGKVQEHIVTIPEGWRVTQIDEYLAKKEIIKKGELVHIASADEGSLFPDTYKFPLDVTPEEIRTAMIDDFNKKTVGLGLTTKDIIIASIVEREAKFDEDRAKIAGVYLIRLGQGLKLQADPTIQYALGNWNPITTSQYQSVQSPFNTYLHNGLPPGPICNPGLKSIEAALHPQGDYLYFFTNTSGHAVFAHTQEEQTANLKKSQ